MTFSYLQLSTVHWVISELSHCYLRLLGFFSCHLHIFYQGKPYIGFTQENSIEFLVLSIYLYIKLQLHDMWLVQHIKRMDQRGGHIVTRCR